MPRKNGKVPSYCLHKASGWAVVRINGRDHYLGRYGSDESHAAYGRLIAEWWQRGHESVAQKRHDEDDETSIDRTLSVAEVLLRYRDFAQGYYLKDGEPTLELTEMRLALRPLRELYGSTVACDFGPLKLKAVR